MAITATNHNQDRILRLNKYVDDLKNRKLNVPASRLHQKESYLQWVDLEIKKAETTISKLR